MRRIDLPIRHILSAAIAAILFAHSGTAAAAVKPEFPTNIVMVGVPIPASTRSL